MDAHVGACGYTPGWHCLEGVSDMPPGYELLPCRLCRCFYPLAKPVVAVVSEPEIKLVAQGNLAAALGGLALIVLDFADVDAQEAVAALDAFFDLVIDPAVAAGLRADQDYRHRSPLQLLVYPL